MAHSRNFTADGPTSAGFETGGDGSGIDNGVVAQGTKTGVTGIGRAAPGTISAAPIGVVGDGPLGVSGIGRVIPGASGSGIGVLGEGPIGVRGSTHPSPDAAEEAGVDGTSTGGIGVRGFSQNNDGIVGVSNGERKSGVFGDSQRGKGGSGVTGRTASPDGFGVFGFSDFGGIGVRGFSSTNHGVVGESKVRGRSGVVGLNTVEGEGAGFGVSGTSLSREGAGVNGFSDKGYGGQFGGGRAPLRLQPAAASGHPTAASGAHQRGELYVDGKGDLFFCKDDGTPGTWFRVQLTPA